MEIDELTEQVIGCAHEVDNELGAGFREKIYENALKIEMKKVRSKSGSSLGTARCVVERTFAWLRRFRRLRVRYERHADIHEAFLTIGCILICYNFINRFC